GLKTWRPAARYAWTHDAYSFSVEQMGFHSNELKRQFEIAQREWAAKQYHKAIPRFMVGYQQYVIRALMTANQAAMRVVQRWKLALYGSMALRQAGYGTKEISEMADFVAQHRRMSYDEARLQHNDADAAAIADHWGNEWILNFIEKKTGDSHLVQKVAEAGFYDPFSRVGRRVPGIKETEEGLLSNFGLNQMMEITRKMRSEGGVMSMLNIMAVGFMNIPLRLARFYANYSPYGLFVRSPVHALMQTNTAAGQRLRLLAGKMQGRPGEESRTFWQQSMKNDLQAQARLREAIAGTGLLLAFGAWQHYHHTSDDDAEKRPFAIFVTGHGPSNKTMRDSWTKRGYNPFWLHVVLNGKAYPVLPITRVGEILAYPLGLAAAQDDLAWRRKQEEAIGRGKPEGISREALAAASTYYDVIGAQGIFQAAGRMTQLQRGGEGMGRAIALTAASAAGGILPWHGLLAGVENIAYGTVDRSSTAAAMMANIPVLNAFVNGKAINRFGDPIGGTTWFSRLSQNLGIPIGFRTPDTPENEAMYGMILDRGAAPPDLRRYIIEEKYGPLSQAEWQKFAQKSGEILKQSVLDNMEQLQTLPPQAVHEFMTRAGESANAQAAASLNLEPVPHPGKAFAGAGPSGGGGGAGGGSESSFSLPKAPTLGSVGLPRPSGGFGRAAMAGARVSQGASAGAAGVSGGGGGGIGPISRRVSLRGAGMRDGVSRRMGGGGAGVRPPRLVSGRLHARSGRIRLARGRKRHRVSLKG
ncbi:MAG TPA: hypothetical protein VMQ76_05660, partial [Terracidiphilus sp.]|nr:hypothetical protein [Terracidiphilus sp.]